MDLKKDLKKLEIWQNLEIGVALKILLNLTFLPTADLKKLEIWQNLEIGVAFQNFAKI